MDIFRLLRKEHAEALNALTAWVRGPEGPDGGEAWARWLERWEVLVRVEESFLFQRLKEDPDLRRLMEHAVEGHVRVRKCAQDMPPPDRGSPAWADAVAGLLGTMEALLELEERRLFPRARSFLSREEAEELASEVEDFLRGLHSALQAG